MLLYLGLEVPESLASTHQVIHYPVIQTVAKPFSEICPDFESLSSCTHLLFTSRSAVRFFFEAVKKINYTIPGNVITVGKATAACAKEHGIEVSLIAKNESSEGIVELLQKQNLHNAFFFWPHSSLSRRVIPDFFEANCIAYKECILYDTLPQRPTMPLNLEIVTEIMFTSPSTVDAFIDIVGFLPHNKRLIPIGNVTREYLVSFEGKSPLSHRDH